MRPLYEMNTIQIELTSACVLKCSNCTRFCGTHKVPFFLESAEFKAAIDSLEGFAKDTPGLVGFMGGEPLLHPQFDEFCDYALSKIPREKLGLWSTFPAKFASHREVIVRTFGQLLLNDHSRDDIFHAPVLMASEDFFRMECPACKGTGQAANPLLDYAQTQTCKTCYGKKTVTNDVELFAATERCWIQESWSASINPKGAWFCEVAGALSDLFDGPEGWKVEKDWWKRTTKDFAEQRDWACRKCGAALPIQRERTSQDERDDVSQSNLERLKAVKSRKVAKGDVVVHNGEWTFDKSLTQNHGYPNQTYKEWEYRQGIAARYGIWLSLNSRGYMEPHLMENPPPRKESLFNILSNEFPMEATHAG